jgi:hypothetical protein
MKTPDWWKVMRDASKGWYVLDKGRARPANDVLEAARALGDIESRTVDRTEIDNEVHVSTVFLCLDQNHSNEGPPILFETMIFGGRHNCRHWRFSALAEAKKAHWEIVDALRIGEEPNPSVGKENWVWRALEEMFNRDEEGEEWKEGTEYED